MTLSAAARPVRRRLAWGARLSPLRLVRRNVIVVAAVCGLCAAIPAAHAIQPQHWEHTAEADFQAGEAKQVVVTNLGDIKLASRTEVIGDMPEQASVIYDLQALGEDLYLAAGPQARILRRRGDVVESVIDLPDTQVFTLDRLDDQLLLGISGSPSRLAVLDAEGQLTDLAVLPDVRYIWDVIVDGRTIFAATGTSGQLLKIDLKPGGGDPTVTVVLDAAQTNLLTLGRDQEGRLYVGTDTDGLIYRVTLRPGAQGSAFVLYDAPEPEIGALVVLPDGSVYAGTADADQARPGRLEEAATSEQGRPDGASPPGGDPARDDDGDGEGDGDGDEGDVPDDLPEAPPSPDPIGDPDTTPDGQADDAQNQGDSGQGGPNQEGAEEAAPAQAGDAAVRASTAAAGPSPRDQPADVEAAASDAADADETDASDAQDAASPAGDPSPEQFQELREVVRQRLLAARGGASEMQARPATGSPTGSRPRQPVTRGRPSTPGETRPGNAIYRISPEGYVREIFRESVMILRMARVNGKLVVATGNEGQLFQVDERADETTLLADLEVQQIPALHRTGDGVTLVATANPAQLVRLDAGFAEAGAYTSPVLDAGQISQWGQLATTLSIPEGQSVRVRTRSGNVGDPSLAPWSEWTDAASWSHDPAHPPLAPRMAGIASPSARFLQYRIEWQGDGQGTAVVDKVRIAYVAPNQRPAVQGVKWAFAGAQQERAAGEARARLRIEWQAADPNNDAMTFRLDYRMAGSTRWIELADQLDQPRFEWDTLRTPDGRYVIRVTASDLPDNTKMTALEASRMSDPVLIDNTRPDFRELKTDLRAVREGRLLTLRGRVADELSPIVEMRYALNAADAWEAILPDDLIFDSTAESFTVTIPDLPDGQNVVTLRARDASGNEAYKAILVP